MKKIKNIGIAGDGGWGTTLAILLAGKEYKVTLWGAFPEYVQLMKEKRENIKFLPDIRLPDELVLTSDAGELLKGKDLIVLAAPSQFMRSVLETLKMDLKGNPGFVSVTKGIENKSLKRMSEVIIDVMGKQQIAVLSGPTIALEVANLSPTTAVIASKDRAFAKALQNVFMTEDFRIYTSDDIVGVELGGALKNIIAIAAGVCDALGFGTNAKAAVLTRGLVEITRLGVAMGAKKETFYGLSGLGDLTTTCISQYSRNRWFGEQIGKGGDFKEILKKTDMAIEGVSTAKAAFELASKFKIDMPVVAEIYNIIYRKKDPKSAVRDLMTRRAKAETPRY